MSQRRPDYDAYRANQARAEQVKRLSALHHCEKWQMLEHPDGGQLCGVCRVRP